MRWVSLAVLLLSACLPGCVAPPAAYPAEMTIPPGRYAAVFEAARESLISLGFEMERIDARHGIIATFPKSTSGLATPWDRDQSTPQQELEDLLNRHFRRAIITFSAPEKPAPGAPALQIVPGPAPIDLREFDQHIIARVEVVLERQRRPGWRLEPTSIRFSSRWLDPDLRGTGMWPTYTVAFSQDPLLAGRVLTAMSRAAEKSDTGRSAARSP